MLEDRFTLLLKDLGSLLKIELVSDENNSCLLNIKDKLKVQLELDQNDQDILLIGSVLGELSPGKFREDILFSALKANAKPYPRIGNFAYSTKLNSLVLSSSLNIDHFTAENVLSVLTPFVHKAYAWKDAIDKGESDHRLEEKDFANMNTDNIFEL